MKTKFNVEGMNCNSCVNKIKNGITDTNLNVDVSLEEKLVFIQSDTDFSNMTMKKTIEELGFSVTGMKKES